MVVHAGDFLEIAEDLIQVDDADHRNRELRLHFLNGGQLTLALLLSVQSHQYAGRSGASLLNAFNGFAHSRASRDDIINNQHPPLQRGTHDVAALAMGLRLLAVEGVGQIQAVVAGQRNRRGGRQGDALVGGAEDHIAFQIRAGQRLGVELPEPCQVTAALKQPGVEEVGAAAPGLELELAKAQYFARDGEFNEFALIGFHYDLLCAVHVLSAGKPRYDTRKQILEASMRVVTVSVSGLRQAIENGFFEWLSGQDADVVAVQDHRVSIPEIEDDPALTPDGYQAWFIDGENASDGGVGFYTRNFPKAIIYGFNDPVADQQGRYLQADFQKVSVVSVFAPGAGEQPERQKLKDDFMESFMTHLGKTVRKRRQYIFCANLQTAHRVGDASTRFQRNEISGFLPHEREQLDEIFGPMGYVDAFRQVNRERKQYSWWPEWAKGWRKTHGWRTDYQFVTPGIKDTIVDGWIDAEAGFSDHAPVVMEYDLSAE